ncbi:MAG: aldo/keto reductase [Pirellulaceae bacterium]|jgi:diketogulonate reductase-like aldo/keto reductase|nr:aldo/keto reductase [Pirellulaceae bacterium]
MEPVKTMHGVKLPTFLYGTAWKEAATQELTELAIAQGFRGIDTANQRKHYDEAAVGRGIRAAMAGGQVARDELFLQTKYTFQRGQDHRLPYNPASPIATQVEESFAGSLEHLGVDQIDSYLLHGPSRAAGLGADDWAAWQAMERIHESGRARLLGVSNVSLEQLEILCQDAKVKPHFVQNRCFAVSGWDRAVRSFCKTNGIVYQGFSLLTANRGVMASQQLATLAQRHGCSPAQLIFRFAIDLGMIALTGTTDAQHMQSDLAVLDMHLQPEEISAIECIAG